MYRISSIEEFNRILKLTRKNIGKIYQIQFNNLIFQMQTEQALAKLDLIFGNRYDLITRIINNPHYDYRCASKNSIPEELYMDMEELSNNIIIYEVMES
jgi:hypothetical protein